VARPDVEPAPDGADSGHGPKADSLPPTPLGNFPSSDAGLLVERLKAIVSGGAGADLEAADKDIASTTESMVSGLKSDSRFGARTYSSSRHPRTHIAAPSPFDAVEGRGTSEQEGSTATEGTWVLRRLQLAAEGAFEELLELERLAARLAAMPPPPSPSDPSSASEACGSGPRPRLAADVNRLIGRLSARLRGGMGIAAPAGGVEEGGVVSAVAASAEEGAVEHADEEVAETPRASARLVDIFGPPFVSHLLGCRKGRVLLRRLLICLSRMAGENLEDVDELKEATLALLWQLMHFMVASPQELWPPAPAEGADAVSAGEAPALPEDDRRRLRHALVWELRRLPSAEGQADAGFEDLLSVLLSGLSRGEAAGMCATRTGALLLRDLLERGGGAGAAEHDLGALIEHACSAVPPLYSAASAVAALDEGEEPELEDSFGSQEFDKVRPTDLLAMMVSLAGRATAAQRQAIQSAMGTLVNEVDSAGGTGS